MRTADHLFRAVRARLDDAAARWLDQALATARTSDVTQLLETYTTASKLGPAPLGAGATATTSDLAPFAFERWTPADAARALMLLARSEAAADAGRFAADAIACYEQGDAGEQRSWLKAVALLPDPAQYRPVVIDACRTNILPNFEAVACENPYPADHFPERNFNQMVLKALFNNVALARIVGLHRRANADLARMAGDYAAERRAAGRTVPVDISLAMSAELS